MKNIFLIVTLCWTLVFTVSEYFQWPLSLGAAELLQSSNEGWERSSVGESCGGVELGLKCIDLYDYPEPDCRQLDNYQNLSPSVTIEFRV